MRSRHRHVDRPGSRRFVVREPTASHLHDDQQSVGVAERRKRLAPLTIRLEAELPERCDRIRDVRDWKADLGQGQVPARFGACEEFNDVPLRVAEVDGAGAVPVREVVLLREVESSPPRLERVDVEREVMRRGVAADEARSRADLVAVPGRQLVGIGGREDGIEDLHRYCLGDSVGAAVAQTTYTASEAARALGISLDTLRRWDRQGRIRVRRDAANRRLISAREIERLRGQETHGLSARNRFPGVVQSVKVEGLLAQVRIAVTEPVEITAIVTADAVAELGLERGSPASAVVKATSVMVER